MSILIKAEEYFRKRKQKNREKIFHKVVKIIQDINADKQGADGLIFALSTASNYDTLYFTLNKTILAANIGLMHEDKKPAKKFYRESKNFLGFLKFLLDFYGGTIGIFWL